jgi:hypothetical protein
MMETRICNSSRKTKNTGDVNSLEVFYEGKPREARNAPWDGGFSLEKDKNDNHFIATSNQGLGSK